MKTQLLSLIILLVSNFNLRFSEINSDSKKNIKETYIAKTHINGLTEKPKLINETSVAVTIDPTSWRGVNLPLFINAHTKKSLSFDDFKFAADAGANVVRLVVFADPQNKTAVSFLDNNGKVAAANSNAAIASLDQAIKMAALANIKIIIDMHTMPGTTGAKIWEDQHYWDTLTQIWTLIAQRFKDNKTVVAFDLMNEPHIQGYIKKQNLLQKTGDQARMYAGLWSPPTSWVHTPRDYNEQIGKLIKAIREVDNNRCVIVEGFGILGSPVNFNWMKPITGFNNVVYSFHMYIPTGLTMLGTKGAMQKGNNIKPFDLARDESKIDKAFAPVLAFQKKYKVPIFVGEFGITNLATFGKDGNGIPYNGACWLSSVIKKMNDNKWGWAYWDFWVPIRKPVSMDDPRYIILSAAMKNKPINYCK